MRAILLFLSICCVSIKAQISEYIYPYSNIPIISNYGTTGLLQVPTARMHEEGTISFSWSHLEPYLRGSIVANPFDWFEASYQYTDVNNYLYSTVKSFSGSQSYKDKGFDAKFRLIKETNFIPEIAVGFRDLGGTALFGGEFIVASKKLGNIDFSVGMGWGTITGNSVSNPLAEFHDRFKDRNLNSGDEDSVGGEVNYGSFFAGEEVGVFAGIEYFVPRFNGLRIMFELDPTNYNAEAYKPVAQDSDFNFGIVYPVNKNLFLKLGYIRGNTLNFGFTYTNSIGGKNPIINKKPKLKEIKNSERFKRGNELDRYNLYRSSLKFLNENRLYLQTAHLSEDESKLSVSVIQPTYHSHPIAIGQTSKILDQLAPDNIESFEITMANGNQPMYRVTFPRKDFNTYKEAKLPYALLSTTKFEDISAAEVQMHEFKPRAIFPVINSKFSPSIRSQIGGPDGFYFGELMLAHHASVVFSRNLELTSNINLSILDNFGDLKLASDSVLPHVRTDIVQYLKESNGLHISNLQFNYFNKIGKNIYTKTSAGLFESMFGGVGGEILYKPVLSNYGIGIEAWSVKQRDYDQMFDFRDYSVVTGHMTLYFQEPRSRILFKLMGGRFLAKDSGLHLDLSRSFKSGLRIGAFIARTDISYAEFGEGSFDKGFYFSLPIDIFFSEYSKPHTGFGLRPITRDGAAFLIHSHRLWNVTDSATKSDLIFDWGDIYD